MNRARLIALAAGFALWIAVVVWRLFELQVQRHEHYIERAERQQQWEVKLDSPRGTIFDARGRELAVSVEVRSVAAHPTAVAHPAAAADALAQILGLDATKLAKRLDSDRGFVWVQRKIDPPLSRKVEDLGLEGIFTLPESKRYYPMGSLAAQILGYVGTDHEGLAGLEFL